MSGGRFEYKDTGLKNEIFGWSDRPYNVFEDREISELVWDVLDLIHDYDWFSCGDTGEDAWIKSKTAFKDKWFGKQEDRTKRIVDQVINDARDELYKTFGIESCRKFKGGKT